MRACETRDTIRREPREPREPRSERFDAFAKRNTTPRLRNVSVALALADDA
jgi:hypothetical protein